MEIFSNIKINQNLITFIGLMIGLKWFLEFDLPSNIEAIIGWPLTIAIIVSIVSLIYTTYIYAKNYRK